MDEETPISAEQARVLGTSVTLQLTVVCAAVGLVWGLALHGNLMWWAGAGAVLGLLVGGVLVLPVVVSKKSLQRAGETAFAARAMWMTLAVLAGLVGVAFWAVRLMSFS